MQEVVSDYPFLFFMLLLLWWCKFVYFFSLVVSSIHNMSCWFILSKHVLNSFIIVVISFLFSKICLLTIFFQNKNGSTSSLDVDPNFSQNTNGSTSSLDLDLNFSQNKNKSTSFLDLDLNFFFFKTKTDLHLP